MKKTLIVVMSLMSACLMFTSCSGGNTLYSWYKYEDRAYEYQKKPTEKLQLKLLSEYEKMGLRQKAIRGIVPPGFYAEYGYLLYKSGKKDEGLKLLREEIKLYPESEVYISRIVKQLEQ